MTTAHHGWYHGSDKDLSNMYSTFINTESANSFYHSDDYDAAYAKAGISADTEEGQWEAYKECDAILAKDLPVSVILHSMNTYLFNDTNYEGLAYFLRQLCIYLSESSVREQTEGCADILGAAFFRR